MNIPEELQKAGSSLASASGSEIAPALRERLNRFLGPSFRAVSAVAVDQQGQRAEVNGLLVCSPASGGEAEVKASTMGCAIDVCELLDLDGLRAAYQRIANAKRLKKPRVAEKPGVPRTTITLGLIFALRASVPLEQLADELDRLNRQTPSGQWPDMVAVLSAGVIHYAMQFPGERELGGYLPPAEGALAAYVPPIYVVMVISATQDYTFNKMYSYMVLHLAIFSPGAVGPSTWQKAMGGIPQTAMAFSGYQYNLGGQLVPVPREFYNDRHIPPRPVLIADSQDKVLCALQFLPWQDGGVILLRGKLPLEMLLVFLGKDALKRGIIKRPELQLSYVLAVTHEDFVKWLGTIQRQSNMKVMRDPTQMVFQKYADEGTSSPFIARLFMGLMNLRDQVCVDEASRREFDTPFDFLLTELLNARTTAQEIKRTWVEHERKVSTGEVARSKPGSIQIDETIDHSFGRQAEDFLNGAVRALKHGMQSLTKTLQMDIGFLFQKTGPFSQGLSALQKTDSLLADYLRQSRQWSEPLLESRNAIEHKGWKLPRITYSLASGKVQAKEPEISGMPVTEFVEKNLDRLICFVEDVMVHCLQAQMAKRECRSPNFH